MHRLKPLLLFLIAFILPSLAQGSALRRCPAAGAAPVDVAALGAAAVSVVTMAGSGSGTVVSPDGFVLTASHVVAGADTVTVKFSDGSSIPATVIREDQKVDVALLRVQAPTPHCAETSADPLAVGAEVWIYGSPLGTELATSLTKGIVSAYRDLDGVRVLQTDASVSPGGSGGGLFGADGRLRGMVGAKVVAQGAEGLSFAVLIASALSALDVQLGDQTDATIEVVRKQSTVSVPDPIVRNRPANPKPPPSDASCSSKEVSTDPFSGVTHVRGGLGNTNIAYDGGDVAHLDIKRQTPGLTLRENDRPEITFDLTLKDGTAIRLYAQSIGVAYLSSTMTLLESDYEIPRDIVGMLATSPITNMTFRVGDANVYPADVHGSANSVYLKIFRCIYANMPEPGRARGG